MTDRYKDRQTFLSSKGIFCERGGEEEWVKVLPPSLQVSETQTKTEDWGGGAGGPSGL